MKKDGQFYKDSGMTYGLSADCENELVSIMAQVDWNLLKTPMVEQICIPLIRRIYVLLKEGSEWQKDIIKMRYSHIDNEKFIKEIDVEELIQELSKYEGFISLGTKYLDSIDAQAELSVLFADNYVLRIIEKVNKENE